MTGIPYDSLVNGRKLYIGKCAGCHNLYAPGSFSRDQWSVIMPKMQGPAKISGSEAKTILNYLNAKALNK
jgi:mono/diheme cytochrome c family protein